MHGNGEIERAGFIEAAGGDGVFANRLQLLQRAQIGAHGRRNGAATRLQLDNVAQDTLPTMKGVNKHRARTNASAAPCGASPRRGEGLLRCVRRQLRRVPDQAPARRRARRINHRRRIRRPIDGPLLLGGRIRLVAAVQEGGGELDRQKACEEQADDGEEDTDACVHEDHSLFVGREIDGGRIAARQADMLVRRVLVCIAPPGLGTGRVGQPASGATLAFYGKARRVINPK